MSKANNSAGTADVANPTADDAGAGDAKSAGVSQTGGDEPQGKGGKNGKVYGQSDVDSIVEKAINRVKREQDEAHKTELEKIERERLEKQGEWQSIAEKERARAQKLEAEIAHTKFLDESRSELREMGLSDFEEVLLTPVKTVDDVKTRAAALQAILAKGIADGVIKKLETGQRPLKPGTNGTAAPVGKWSEMSRQSQLAFIKEHGHEAASRLQFEEAEQAGRTGAKAISPAR